LDKLLRHDTARQAHGPGGGTDQRRARPVVDRRLPAAGHHDGYGVLAADDGDAPRGGAVAAAGQHLPAPARSPDGRERLEDGALRRRLRDPVRYGRRGTGGTAPTRGEGGSTGPE